ncbi:MAG: glutamine synthetase family protein [Roseburia sp.]|nr:glutamine synthetase family protein [Roseburia sp.]
MANDTKQDIIRMVEEEDVGFIRLQFADSFGALKNVAMTSNHLDRILNNQCMFDGAAIQGYDTKELSEFILAPDLDTFTIFPWRPQSGRVARFICDVLNPDGTPYEADPRHVLKKVLADAKKEGYTFHVGPENQFFLFDTDEDGQPTTTSNEKGGFFDIGPLDSGENARRDMVLSLEEMGFIVESSYHSNEVAQHCIELMTGEGLKTADDIMTFKLTARTVARRHGLHATFMPKPAYGKKGSAMMLNMYLSKNGKNIFEDETTPDGLSKTAYRFMAGIINHIKGLTLINNPIINSYKRLVPGYNAPVDITWSRTNRTPLIRITNMGAIGSRVVLRSPDGASNPYLVLAGCLAAGLQGIREKMEPPVSMDEVSSDSPVKFEILPRTLREAILAFEADQFLQDVFGKTLSEIILREKKEEWEEFSSQVTAWEVEKYLDRI